MKFIEIKQLREYKYKDSYYNPKEIIDIYKTGIEVIIIDSNQLDITKEFFINIFLKMPEDFNDYVINHMSWDDLDDIIWANGYESWKRRQK